MGEKYILSATKIDDNKYLLNSFSYTNNTIVLDAQPMDNTQFLFVKDTPGIFKLNPKTLNLVNMSNPVCFGYNEIYIESNTKYLIFTIDFLTFKVNNQGSLVSRDSDEQWIPKTIINDRLTEIEYLGVIYKGDIEATSKIIEKYNKLKEEEMPTDQPTTIDRYKEPTGLDSIKSTVEYNQENFGYMKDDDGVIEHFSYTNSESAELFTWIKRGSVGTDPKEAQITPKNNEQANPDSPTVDPTPPEIEPTKPEIEPIEPTEP